MIWPAVLAFFCGAIYDVLNVRFLAAATSHLPLQAALYSTLVGACGLTGIVESVHDPRAIPFLLAGYFVGTFVAVRWKR